MRLIRSFALLLVLLSFLDTEALSVNWDDPESQTIDEMFAGDYGSVYGGLPFTSPQDSRAAQAGERSKEIINLPIGGNHSTATVSSQQTESQGPLQATATQPVVANLAAQNQPRPASASGTWRLEMSGDLSRNATLTLFQSGGTVFGKGEIKDADNTTLAATASGIVAADKLTLDLVVPEKLKLYRLSLTVSGDSASGIYTEFSTTEEPATGTFKGLRTISPS